MRIIVTGGRKLADAAAVDRELSTLRPTLVIVGGAGGADRLAAHWAWLHKAETWIYDADWNAHGKAAGPIRNQRMLDENPGIDAVVAFPGGSGTADMVRRARAAGVRVIEVGS